MKIYEQFFSAGQGSIAIGNKQAVKRLRELADWIEAGNGPTATVAAYKIERKDGLVTTLFDMSVTERAL